MLKSEFPLWYPFQEIDLKHFKPDIDEIREFISQRVQIYLNKDSEDIEFKRGKWEEEDEYFERIIKDRKGYSLMRIGASIDEERNSYLGKWFVEEEGDLFEKRFREADWKIKVRIMDELFPKDQFGRNWMELDELNQFLNQDLTKLFSLEKEEEILMRKSKSKFAKFEDSTLGLQKYIAIHFRYAPFLVRTRKAQIYKGWTFGTMERFLSTVKKRFESKLINDLNDFGLKIKTEAPGPVKNRSEQINKLMKELIPRSTEFEFSHFEFDGGYEENVLVFPPCIQDLMIIMKEKGYLEHHKRFQLGLFLKHTGMSVEEQMQYWFNFAVDNQNISYEEFEKRVGYTIRHLYGLEGKQTDYEMISCGTIQSSGSYYCRFQDLSLDSIKLKMAGFIQSLPGDKQKEKADMFTQELDPKVGRGLPSEACAINLKLTLGPIQERISHPMRYLEMAARTSNRVKIVREGNDDNEKIVGLQNNEIDEGEDV